MVFKISELKVDEEKARSGVWVEIEDGWHCLIAHWDNSEFQEQVVAKFGRGQKRRLRASEVDTDRLEHLKELVARYIILGWRGLFDDDGKTPINYSSDKALELLRMSNAFYQIVVQESINHANFRIELEEGAAGNSPTTSGGGSSGDPT